MSTDPPKTERRETSETMHGEDISDPYRWLEGDDGAVQKWISTQNEYADSHLQTTARDELRPQFEALAEIAEFFPIKPTSGGYFQRVSFPDDDLPVLSSRDVFDGERRVLADPNEWSDDGTLTINWFVPSPDGSLVAYGVMEGGTEQYDIRVIDSETGGLVDELRDVGRSGEFSFAWDETGFYYGRTGTLDEEGQLDKSLAYHRLGDDGDDHEFAIELDDQTWGRLHTGGDGEHAVAALMRDWERTDVYYEQNGEFEPLVVGEDAIFDPQIHDDRVFFRTSADAPNYRIARTNFDGGDRTPNDLESVIPEKEAILWKFAIAGDHLVVQYERNAISELSVFTLDGDHVEDVSLPGTGSIDGLHGVRESGECFFRFQSFDQPPTVYRYVVGDGLTEIDRPAVSIDADLEVEQEWYESKDGTEVPMFIVHAGVELDGDNPTVLYGYGGFDLSQSPTFRQYTIPFVERGGVFAVANVRGGGEFGEEWHHAARKERKQNTFDDFIAGAEYLAERGYTRPERLGIEGRSNGGLTVGATLTQRPDLFSACLCAVPLLDMLRFHNFLLGASWTSEYGSPDDPDDFEYIREYSPYHNVEEREYPAVLFKTAEGDSRVHPFHARKMTARMQGLNTADRPVLLREEQNTGHGTGKPTEMVVREKLDEWSFFFEQLAI
ncbi:prolyl oligopeptidase family serine peptidase [Haladaptatus cibarius]|uniref:prolyl oligopeptidase family serine peptidase n=1 Tax=Haladaptatus cibarius TaxID=453847 RepID=UPI0006788785|nr:prolyl oligopeptidase family serine peptidase [Haladaptatus cibarius]